MPWVPITLALGFVVIVVIVMLWVPIILVLVVLGFVVIVVIVMLWVPIIFALAKVRSWLLGSVDPDV